jgi:hypothetical protein
MPKYGPANVPLIFFAIVPIPQDSYRFDQQLLNMANHSVVRETRKFIADQFFQTFGINAH